MSKWFYQRMKLVVLLSLVFLGGCDLFNLALQIPLASDNSSLKWTLTTQTEGEGTVSMDPPGGSYDQNTVVSLLAHPADGWQFKSWKTSTENVEVWFQTVWNPSIVIMSSDKTVVAVFEKIPSPGQFHLTANTLGYGTVTLNPSGGWYDNATDVQVQALANAGWHFDHWEGDLTGSSNPAWVTMNDNKTISAVFMQSPIAAAPIFTPDNGTVFVGTQAVQLASSTPGATIYYTTDGSDPNESSSMYTGTFTLSSTTTVKARAYANLMDPSPISSATYVLQNQVATPLVSPASQTFYHSLDLYIYCSTAGASIYYTTDGTDPNESSNLYTGTFYLLETTTIKSRAFMAGKIPSNIISETYTSAPPGTLSWTFTTGGSIEYSSPAIDNYYGTVYIGSSDGKLYAINMYNGAKKWEFGTGAAVHSSPVIGSDRTVYIGSDEGALYAIYPDNGTVKWTFNARNNIESTPAIGLDETIYVGSNSNMLFAIDPNGIEKWRFITQDMIVSSPAIGSDGTIYVGSNDNKTYALHPDGTERWEFLTGSEVMSAPAIGPDRRVYMGSEDGKLYAFDPGDGTKIWEFAAASGFSRTSPAFGLNNGLLFAGSYDTKLYALNPNTGAKVWEFATGNPIQSSPAVGANGTVYVGSDDGKLYAVKPDNGTKLWEFSTGGGIRSSPAIGWNGNVYVGSMDGKLYAIYGGENLAGTAWPMFQHDVRHTSQFVSPIIILPTFMSYSLTVSQPGNMTASFSVIDTAGTVVSVVADLYAVGGPEGLIYLTNTSGNSWEFTTLLYPWISGSQTITFTAYDNKGNVGILQIPVTVNGS